MSWARESYQLLVAASGYSLETESALVAAFLSQRLSGLVLTGLTHARRTIDLLARADMPVVETWSLAGKPSDMLVGFWNERASFEMMRTLAEAGYRKIGLVSAPVKDNDRALGRRKGYRRALRELGLVEDRRLEREAHFSLQNGSLALCDLVEQHPNIEAIFFANDILAAGGLLECVRRGWPVPERLGIAGFRRCRPRQPDFAGADDSPNSPLRDWRDRRATDIGAAGRRDHRGTRARSGL